MIVSLYLYTLFALNVVRLKSDQPDHAVTPVMISSHLRERCWN